MPEISALSPWVSGLSTHGLATLAFCAVVFALFIWDRLPITTVCLGILVALPLGFALAPLETASGNVDPMRFYAGFGHPALIAICGLMVVGHALVVTGALEPAARRLSAWMAVQPGLALLAVLVGGAAVSGVINDTPVVVLLIPLILAAAARAGTSGGRMLLPINYAVLIGGMATSIGTSTNLIVVALAASLGVGPFGLFSFYPLVAMAAIPAIAYLWLVAPRLLANVEPPVDELSEQVFDAELRVEADSWLEGKTLGEVFKATGSRMRLVDLRRNDRALSRLPSVNLRAGDRLLLQDTAANLKDLEGTLKAALHDVDLPDAKAASKADSNGESSSDAEPAAAARLAQPPDPHLSDRPGGAASTRTDEPGAGNAKQARADAEAEAAEQAKMAAEKKAETEEEEKKKAAAPLTAVVSQMIVMPTSPLIGRSVRQERIADRYGAVVVGLRAATAHAGFQRGELADRRIEAGDILLLQGDPQAMREVQRDGIGLLLDAEYTLPRQHAAGSALFAMTMVVLLAATKTLPIALAALCGVIFLLAVRCLSWQDVTNALSVKVVMLVAASLALGDALELTGATAWLAQQLAGAAGDLAPAWVLAVLMMLMGLLTNFVSNNAAAAIGTPLGIELARSLGVPPEPFVLAVLFGCNLCYLTPMGYQTNLLVMNAGGYRFADFVRVGTPLFLIMWAGLSYGLTLRYGL